MSNIVKNFCKYQDTKYLDELYEYNEELIDYFVTEAKKALKDKKNKKNKKLKDMAKIVIKYYNDKQKIEKAKLSKMKVPTIEYTDSDEIKKFIKPTVKEAIKLLHSGESEVVLIPIDEKTRELIDKSIKKDLPNIFTWYNNAVTKEYQVPPPTMNMMRDPEKYHKKWAPYISKGYFEKRDNKFSVMGLSGSGMVNYYNGHVHNTLIRSDIINEIFTESTGTDRWKINTNRLRFNLVGNTRKDWSDTMHLEGLDVGLDTATNHFGVIVSISNKRSFVWWEGTATDKTIRTDIRNYYIKRGGVKTGFIGISKKDALTKKFLKGRRRRIIYDSSKYILLFTSACAHEVDAKQASTSVFLTPYNPDNKLAAINLTSIKDRTWRAKTLYQPNEYTDNLTSIQTEIMGLGFNNPGSYWPSRKEVFFLNHQTSVGIWIKRVKQRYKCPTKMGIPDKNVCYQLPDNGEVDQHNKKYEKKLIKYGITEIPSEMFDKSYPNLVVDILKVYGKYPMLQYRRSLRLDFPAYKK